MEILTVFLNLLPLLLVLGLVCAVVYMVVNRTKASEAVCVILAGILIVTTAIPTIQESIDRIERGDGLEYDDYIAAVTDTYEVVLAYGSLELVTVNDSTYVHAKDVGEGTVVYADGTVKEIQVYKAKLDIVMIAGQSNAAYEHKDPTTATVTALGTAYYYGIPETVVEGETIAAYPVDSETYHENPEADYGIYAMSDGTRPYIGNLEPAIAAEWYAETGHKLLTVNTGWGGKSIIWFNPSNREKAVTESMTAIWNGAISKVDTAHYDVTVAGYIWIQGETSPYGVERYTNEFMQVLDWITGRDPAHAFAEDSTYNPQTCYISLLHHKVGDDRSVASNEAQVRISESDSRVRIASALALTFTPENGLMKSDDLHYSQAGDNLLGCALADYIANAMKE